LVNEVLAILNKDLVSEFRTKVALNAIFLFSLTVLFLVSFVVGPYKIRTLDQPAILSAWLWIIVFFSGMSGLDRVFVKEEETSTAPGLQLAARSSAVFLGKFLFNLCLMGMMGAVVTPLYIVLMEFSIASPLYFAAEVFFGILGMTTGVTLIAAMVAKARMKGALFSILSFPIIIPLLLVAIEGTSKAATGISSMEFLRSISVIGSFAGAMFVLSLILFEKVWIE